MNAPLTTDIPDDTTLHRWADDDDPRLRELAADVPGVDATATDTRVVRNLKAYRDGGTPMQCSGCGHLWVYAADQTRKYVTCPNCYSKQSVRQNAIQN